MKPPAASLTALLGACLLNACAAPLPPPAMPCIAVRPVAPVLPRVPQQGIYAQAQALLARDKLQQAYARQLEALLDACI